MMQKILNLATYLKNHPVILILSIVATCLSIVATCIAIYNGIATWRDRISSQQPPRIGILGLTPQNVKQPPFISEPFRTTPSKLTVLHVGLSRQSLIKVSDKVAACIKIPIVVGSGSDKIMSDARVIFRYFDGQGSASINAEQIQVARNRPGLCNFEEITIGAAFAGETMKSGVLWHPKGYQQIAYRISDLYPDKMAYLHFYIGAEPNTIVVDDNAQRVVPDDSGEITTKTTPVHLIFRPSLITVSTEVTKSEEKAGYVLLLIQLVDTDADLLTTGIVSSDEYVSLLGQAYGIAGIKTVEEIFWAPQARLVGNDLMQEIFGKDNPSIPEKAIALAKEQGASKFLILSEGRFSNGCYRGRILRDTKKFMSKIQESGEWMITAPLRDYVDLRNSARAAAIIQRQRPSDFRRMAESHLSSMMPLITGESEPLADPPAEYFPILAVWNGCVSEVPSPKWYQLGG